MTRRRGALLIPDAGPLFSLAACRHLEVLLNFECAITDVVWRETAGRAGAPAASAEASAIAAFLAAHPEIEVRETQLGRLTQGSTALRNVGELSIHSLLIELRAEEPDFAAVVLFEDRWFERNIAHLPRGVTLIGTTAFLEAAQRLGLIASAAQALAEIRRSRNLRRG